MVDWKKLFLGPTFWILIAAILALISIFTPIASMGTDTYIFWTAMIGYSPDLDPEWGGFGAATIWTLVLTSMSIALLLWYGIHNMKGMEFKWDWLVYLLIGIVLIIFPILMLVYDLDNPYYGTLDIGFGPIGILISGILSIVGFVMDKFVGGRE